MTGYDAATVEACAKLAAACDLFGGSDRLLNGDPRATIAAAIRALPIAPPAPLDVAADDAALIEAFRGELRRHSMFVIVGVYPKGYDQAKELAALVPPAPAVDETELDRLRKALNDIRARASETSMMPSYRLGQIMAHIDEIARVALIREGSR